MKTTNDTPKGLTTMPSVEAIERHRLAGTGIQSPIDIAHPTLADAFVTHVSLDDPMIRLAHRSLPDSDIPWLSC